MAVAPLNTAAVLLAGGLGTRIRHLLPEVPKPMASVLGRPFLEWIARYLAKEGVRQVVISTGYLGEKIASHFAAQPVPGTRVSCVREETALGTAGGFLHAAQASGLAPANWLVLNGDSLALASLRDAAALLGDDTVAGSVFGVAVDDASRFGTLAISAEGLLQGFREKRPGAGVVNAGIYLLRPWLLDTFPADRPLSFETAVFPRWVADGRRLKVNVVAGPFLDIGTPESLPQAESFVRRHADWFADD
jgi:NDP-sugar pyrophosphorylase family protein